MSKGRCVDCGYLSRQDPRDGSWVTLTEFQRQQLAQGRYVDEALACYVSAPDFTQAGICCIIDCAFYIRRTPEASPQQHMNYQDVIDSREAYKKELKGYRWERWILAGITIMFTTAAVIVAALIGSGHILS